MSIIKDWLNKTWHIHKMECKITLIKDKEVTCVLLWKDPQHILLSKKKCQVCYPLCKKGRDICLPLHKETLEE